MTDDNEDELLPVDLRVWRVPPPPAVDARSLVLRALSPATAPSKRPRLRWILAAIVLINAAIATLIIVLVVRPPVTQTTVAVQPAGGGSVDAQVRDLLQRLEDEQRELERKLAEIEELRAVVIELSDKVRRFEEEDARRARTVPKAPARIAPDRPPVVPPVPPAPVATDHAGDTDACDEVSCVLTNYGGTCCLKYRRQPGLPEALDRQQLSNGVASVKASVAACGTHSKAHGVVKVHIVVSPDGVVTNVSVAATPDAALGACVAGAVGRAVFARTQNGGSFTYPFAF